MRSRILILAVSLCLRCIEARAEYLVTSPFTAFPISTTTQHFNTNARIDGHYVLWSDEAYPGGPTGDNDAYAYDLLSGQKTTLAAGVGEQDAIGVSGNTAIWYDRGAVKGRDLSTGGGTFSLSGGYAISGNLVVYNHNDGLNKNSIWGNKPDGSDFSISGSAAYDQERPDVSGSLVVWMSLNEPGDPANIYGRDLNGGGVIPISTSAGSQLYPKVSGRTVIWEDWSGAHVQVWGKNFDSGNAFPISSGIADQFESNIDGDLVVWADQRNGNSDIWGRYLSGGPEFQITNTPDIDEDNPDVSGNIVVWTQHEVGADYSSNIYGTVVPDPATCSSLVLLLAVATLPARNFRAGR